MNWVLFAVVSLIVLMVLSTFFVSYIIYRTLLMRTSQEKWGRNESMPEDEEYNQLYRQAMAWRKEWMSFKRDVAVTSDGLRLCGEYFDFGNHRAVIIVPGRMESCHYSCHYAEPYRKAGWNVLTIDGRAHGLSEGRINSLGYREFADILEWARFLHEEEHNQQIMLHGICIGASTVVFAASDDSCPDYVTGVVVDGMYQRFYDSMLNHMVQDHRPLFPFLYETMLFIRLISKADVVHDGPIYRMPRMKKPILFLHSREDRFSTPDKAQALYRACKSSQKQIFWFEHGAHSRVRNANTELYDQVVMKFANIQCMNDMGGEAYAV